MLARKLDEVLTEISPPQEGSGVHALFPQWADAPISTPITAPVEPERAFDAVLDLQSLTEAKSGDDAEAWHLPPPGIHTTGSQLRHRLVTPESIAELAAHHRPSLVQRLLALRPRRK